MDISDFIEALFTGRWRYLAGLFLGVLTIGVIRLVYSKWQARQAASDAGYAESHKGESLINFKKKAGWLRLTVLLLFAIMAASLWVAVQILGSFESVSPGIALLVVFLIFCLFTVLIIVQSVRAIKLSRRIKLMKQAAANPEAPKQDQN